MMADTPCFDLDQILALRRDLKELAPTAPPSLRVIAGSSVPPPRRLALLPGSFNPPTTAHLALAQSALDSGAVDAVSFTLATRTVNKERVEGASLADRLLLLRELVRPDPRLGVVAINRGLYVDQAETARRALPGVADLFFVVGFDKIVQIFDPRYYEDRDAALDRLFRSASLLVAPRGDADTRDLRLLLSRPENQKYAGWIHDLALAPEFRVQSSSLFRQDPTSPVGQAELPPVVRQFVEQTGTYLAPIPGAAGETIDRYALREQLIDLAEQGELGSLQPMEFKNLVERVSRADQDGQLSRARLARGEFRMSGQSND